MGLCCNSSQKKDKVYEKQGEIPKLIVKKESSHTKEKEDKQE